MDQDAKKLLKIYAYSVRYNKKLPAELGKEIHKRIGIGEFPDLYSKKYKNNSKVLDQVIFGNLIPKPAINPPLYRDKRIIGPVSPNLGGMLRNAIPDDKKAFYNDTVLKMPELKFSTHNQSLMKNLWDQWMHELKYRNGSLMNTAYDIAGRPRPKPAPSPIVFKHPVADLSRNNEELLELTSLEALDRLGNTSGLAKYYNSREMTEKAKRSLPWRGVASLMRTADGIIKAPLTIPHSLLAKQQSPESTVFGSLIPASKYLANSAIEGVDKAQKTYDSSQKAGDNAVATALKMYFAGRMATDEGFAKAVKKTWDTDPFSLFLDFAPVVKSSGLIKPKFLQNPKAGSRAAKVNTALQNLDRFSQRPIVDKWPKSGTIAPEDFAQAQADREERPYKIREKWTNYDRFWRRRSVLPR